MSEIAVYRRTRYERRIAALEARVADLVEMVNAIGPTAIEAAAKSNALMSIWTQQADQIPGEEKPLAVGRGAWIN